MPKARIWVFNVEQGFMAFVRAPSGATLAIDCGKASDFSPTIYVRENELNDPERQARYPISELVVTHPHDDHIEDIQRLAKWLKPGIIHKQRYDWEEVEEQSGGDYANLRQWAKFQEEYNSPVDDPPDWGAVKVTHWCLTVDQANALNEAKFINNSSIITIVEVGSFKMTFPGDIEKDGWLKMLERDQFCAALRGTSIFVTSHHGHSSGYTPEIYAAMGKPWFNLSSIHHGDLAIESAYSTAQTACGAPYNGETRYSITTRRDGSCLIQVDDQGNWRMDTYRLGANLPKPTSYGRGW